MADDLPSNAQFKLPEDVQSLSQMRDQLGDYLNTLERNTDSVNAWLAANQNNIIVGLHRLNRAFAQNNEQDAIKRLSELGEIAGFVLSIQDFKTLGEKTFGSESAFVKELAKIETGIPKKILEDLPDIALPDQKALAAAEAAKMQEQQAAANKAAPEPEAKKKKWWNPGTWFDKSEQEAAEARRISEEEAQRQIDEIKRNWRLVKSELISLQSDRHYYIDSFMDMVGETLAPSPGMKDPEIEKLMVKYQNPQVVIDLAMDDYAQVMDIKANALRERARLYAKTAALIDEQKIAEFSTMLPALFPKTDTVETKQIKDLLLQDYGVTSFADMALERVTRKDEQLMLLKTALQLEPELKLNGINTQAGIFERIVSRVTAKDDPLDSSALQLVLDKYKGAEGTNGAQVIGLNASDKTIFQRLADRFSQDLPGMEKAFRHVLQGLGAKTRAPETQLKDFVASVRAKDAMKLGGVLSSIANSDSSQAFKGLWNLTYPNTSLVGEITKAAKTTSDLSSLMGLALGAGLVDEFKANSNAALGSASNALDFFNNKVMPDHADFSLVVVRRLLATSFANGGLDQLRRELTRPGGWLEQVVKGPLNAEGRANWVAALLEPWTSPIVKSNILAEAATAARDPEAKKALQSLDDNLTGSNIRLDDGRILTNLDKVANIWYDAQTKAVRLTVNGMGHSVLEDVTPQMAKEILTHIQRKAPMLQSEYDGLYNPKNIDRIVTKQGNTQIFWGNHAGVLNVPEETVNQLHKSADYMHVTNPKNGIVTSVNLKTVALLQPLEDGSHLLVDKFGEVQVLEGKLDIQAQGDLLNLSGTYFNPRNASVLSLDPTKNKIEFRAESKDFEDLLENAAPGQYFYGVELSKPDLERVKQAIAAAPAIVAPGGNNLQNLYFNFETLGYMMFSDERETGFNVRRNGPAKKPGFIAVEQEDLAKNIFAGLSANPNLVVAGNVVTHKSLIDDAYYSPDKKRIYMVLSNDILQIPATEQEAYPVLKKLSREDGFTTVGASVISNPAGVGTVEMPADIVNLGRAVVQFHSDAQDKTFLVAENDRFFHIGYDRKQAESLFDMQEDKGLEKARAATPKNLAWTKDLRGVSQALPQQPVKVMPSLTDTNRDYLLGQLTGKTGAENRAMPQPKVDFSVAAAPLKTGQQITYPARTRIRPAAPKI